MQASHSHSWECEIQNYNELTAKCIDCPYLELGGFSFLLSVFPDGDGYMSDDLTLNLSLVDSLGSKRDCFARFKITLVNQVIEANSFSVGTSYRFKCNGKSFGWSNYKKQFDLYSGFLTNEVSLVITVDICLLNETTILENDRDKLNGKFTWMIKNYSLFEEMIKTEKIISPGFLVGESSLQLGFETSVVNGVEYLALRLEINDTKKDNHIDDQSCWFKFKISVLSQKQGLKDTNKDSYGRRGDDTRLGWNDFMTMSDFIGFLVDDTVTLSVSFNAIKDSCSLREIGPGSKSRGGLMSSKSDSVMKCDGGRFEWRIEKFTWLKDQLKKKKITGLCVKSKRFQIGNQDFRLLLYPRGQSQEPSHLSIFLEVLDAQNRSGDRSCFVNYRLSVVNQKNEDKSITKESQNRSSEVTKDWGWPKFMTLTSLYGQDSGYILEETAVFAAEVYILKEELVMQDITDWKDKAILFDTDRKRKSIKWKMENFLSFKDTMETQNIFSKSFMVGECKLRIGVHVSVDNIYADLECDPSVASDPDKNFWVSYRMAVVNQKDPAKTLWRESYLCTKTSMNYDLQPMKLSDMREANAGFVILDCEVLDYCPLFFSSEQEVLAEVSTGFYGLIDAVTGSVVTRNEADISRKLLETTACLSAFTGLLVRLRLSYGGPLIKHLLCQPGSDGVKVDIRVDESSPILKNLMEALNFLQQKVDDLLLVTMVVCCQPLKGCSGEDSYDTSSEPSPETSGAVCQLEDSIQSSINERLYTAELLGFVVNSLKALNGPVSQGHPESGQGKGPRIAKKISIVLDKAPKQLLPDLIKLLPKLVNHSEHPSVAFSLLEQLQRPDAEAALLPPILDVIRQLHFGSEVWEKVLSRASNDEELGATIHFLFKAASQCQRIPQAVKAVRERLESLGAEVSPSVLDLLSNTMNSRVEIAKAMLREIDSVFALDEKCLHNLDGPSLYGENAPATKSLDPVAELLRSDRHFSNIFFLIDMLAIPSLAIEASKVFERGIVHGFIVNHSVAIVVERIRVDSVSSAENFQQNGIAGKGNMNSLCAEEVFTLLLRLAETLSLSRDSRVHGFVKMFYALLFRLFADESYRNKMLKGLVGCATSPSDNCCEMYLDILVFLILGEDGVSRPVLGMILKNSAELANANHDALCDRLCAREYEISNMVREKAILLEKLSDSETEFQRYKSETMLEMDRFAQEKNELSKRSNASMQKSDGEKKVLAEKLKRAEAELKRKVVAQEERRQSLLDEVEKWKQEVERIEAEKQEKEEEITQCKAKLTENRQDFARRFNAYLQKSVAEKNVDAAKLKRAEDELKIYRTEVVAQGERRQSLLDEVRQLKQEVERIEGEKQEKEKEITYYKEERERCDIELKRYHADVVAKEEVRQSLLDEVRQLKQEVEREKEEEIARCKAYIEELVVRLNHSQQTIQSLQGQLQEEMSKIASLCGVNLENLSTEELQNLKRIHVDGLRKIHALLRPTAPPPMADGPPIAASRYYRHF